MCIAMNVSDLVNRMRVLEETETKARFDSSLPLYVRIDGRSFSKFTRSMKKPFDERLSKIMITTMKYLVEKTHALIGYTQSDEINLVYLADEGSQVIFNSRVQKLVSVLAAQATTRFNKALSETSGMEHYTKMLPHFDCRVIQMPTKTDAADMILLRELDAIRNSVSMAAQHVFSHRELQNKSTNDLKTMLATKGINFESYPTFFKRGTYARRETEERTLTEMELAGIPEEHRAAKIGQTFLRSVIKEIDMPPFKDVSNREGVIFNKEEPA